VIITSSPLRIFLGGGGTDLPSYYHENADLMHLHWEPKKQRSELGRANGALGGKLIGAGGGGFLMFYTEDKTRLRRVMTGEGLREIRFGFDFAVSQVIVQS
jgi:D-glycero-alpha-D-manno-heptose-7-phosphate kinase